MKKKFVNIIAVCAIVMVFVLVYFWYSNHRSNHIIKVSGTIEATETRLSFRIVGRISRLFADEGYSVKKGQVLAMLDKDELLKIKEQAQADLEKAESDYNLREKEYSRYQVLIKTDAVSANEKDTAQNLLEVASTQLVSSQKALELADTRLSYADMNSSTDGFVLVKSAEVGEVLQPGSPVFTVTDLNDIWLTAYINETDLGKVKLNQAVDIKTDSYPDKTYKGRVSFISEEAEFTPKYIQTTEERVKLVYRVKIDVNNPNFELKPGMPADGYIIE